MAELLTEMLLVLLGDIVDVLDWIGVYEVLRVGEAPLELEGSAEEEGRGVSEGEGEKEGKGVLLRVSEIELVIEMLARGVRLG